jgi:hypothetical protein
LNNGRSKGVPDALAPWAPEGDFANLADALAQAADGGEVRLHQLQVTVQFNRKVALIRGHHSEQTDTRRQEAAGSPYHNSRRKGFLWSKKYRR